MPARPAPAAIAQAVAAFLTHKHIRGLRAASFGGALLIAMGMLEDGLDPETASNAALMSYARCTPNQWIHCRSDILEALRLAMPDIRAVYDTRAKITDKLSHNAKIGLAQYRFGKRSKNTMVGDRAANLSDKNYAPVLLHPLKAPVQVSEKYDVKARAAVQLQQARAFRDAGRPPGGLHD